MASDNKKKLYDNLLSSDKVGETQLGSYEQFDSLISNSDNAKKFRNNLIKNKIVTELEIGDEESFLKLVGSKQPDPVPVKDEESKGFFEDMWNSFKGQATKAIAGIVESSTPMAGYQMDPATGRLIPLQIRDKETGNLRDFSEKEISQAKKGPEKLARTINEKGDEILTTTEKFDKGIFESFKSGEFRDGGKQLAQGISGSMAYMIPFLISTPAAIYSLGSSAKGSKSIEMKKEIAEGKSEYSPIDIELTSLGYGGAEVAGDVLLGGMFKSLKKALEIAKIGGSGSVKETVSGFAKEYAKSIVAGGGSEVVTGTIQRGIERYGLDKDVSLIDGMADEFILGGTFPALTGGGAYITGKALNKVSTLDQKNKVKSNNKTIESLNQELSKENLTDTQKNAILETITSAQADNNEIMLKAKENISTINQEGRERIVHNNSLLADINETLGTDLGPSARAALLTQKLKIQQETEAALSPDSKYREGVKPDGDPDDTSKGEKKEEVNPKEEAKPKEEIKVEEKAEPKKEAKPKEETDSENTEVSERLKSFNEKEKPTTKEKREFNKGIRDVSENLIDREGVTPQNLKEKVKEQLTQQEVKFDEKIIDREVDKVSKKYAMDETFSTAITELKDITNIPSEQKTKALQDFVKKNKETLKGIGLATITGKKKKMKDATITKQIERISARLEGKIGKAITSKRKDVESSIKKIKDKSISSAANKYSKLTTDESSVEIEGLESKVDKLKEQYESEGNEELLDQIATLENEIEVANAVSGLDEMDFSSLSRAEKNIKAIHDRSSDQIKKFLKDERTRINERVDKQIKATKGRFDLESKLTVDTGKKSLIRKANEFVSGAVEALRSGAKGFQNYQNGIKYLFKRMDKSFELGTTDGKTPWNPKNFIGKDFDSSLRQGESKRQKFTFELKKKVNDAIRTQFGSLLKAKKIAGKMIDVPFVEVTVNKETGDVVKTEVNRAVSMETAAHLLYSSTSEANSEYMSRLGLGSRKLEATDSTIEFLNKLMSEGDGAKLYDLTVEIADNILPTTFKDINKVFKSLSGTELTRLDGYLPVNGIGLGNEKLDLSKMDLVKIYQSMTKTRIGGRYDLDRNGVISGTMNYIESSGKFIGLAKPMSDIVRVLTNKKYVDVTKARDLDGTRQAILKLLSEEISPTKTVNMGMELYKNFIVSKVAFHFGLVPKQMVSTLAALDPEYASNKNYLKALAMGVVNKEYRQIAKSILEESYDFKQRNLAEIESMVTEAGKKGWNLDVSKKIGEKIQSLTDKLPDKQRDAANTIMEYIYMPTKFGDQLAIKSAGRPLILASYLDNMESLKENGVIGNEAEIIARRNALYTFEEWMNNTQQTTRFTDRALFQTGFWRFAMPFTNSLRLYADKITDAYSDLGRNYLSGIDHSKTGAGKYLKAIKGVNKSGSFQKILLYQVAMPVLFSQVGRGFNDVRTVLYGDDEKEKEEAWKELMKEGLLSWTNGLLLLGKFIAYGTTLQEKGRANKGADNVVTITDDVFGLIESITKVTKGEGMEDLNDFEKEELMLKSREAYKNIFKSGLNIIGLPGESVRRYEQSVKETEADEMGKRLMYNFGANKDQVDAIYGTKDEGFDEPL